MLLGVLLRAGLAVYAHARPAAFDFPDSRRYVQVARHIAAGLGPIDSPQMRSGTDPLYPALLSLGPRLGFDAEADVMLLGRAWNILFAALGIGLVGVLGASLATPRAGLVAAGIAACDPISLYFCALVLTETCYTTLLLAALYGLTRLDGPRPMVRAVIIGASLALGALARSSSVPIILIFLLLVWAWTAAPARRKYLACLATFVGFAGLMTPTLLRNYRLFDAIVPVRIGGGASLLEALGPWADGAPGMDRIRYPDFPPNANELERDRLCRAAALDWARANPRQAATLGITKLRRTWSLGINASGYDRPFYTAVSYLSVTPVFVFALIGLVRLRAAPRNLVLLLTPPVYFTLLHMVFVGSIRYRMPAMPCLFILAGVAAAWLWDAVGRRSART